MQKYQLQFSSKSLLDLLYNMIGQIYNQNKGFIQQFNLAVVHLRPILIIIRYKKIKLKFGVIKEAYLMRDIKSIMMKLKKNSIRKRYNDKV